MAVRLGLTKEAPEPPAVPQNVTPQGVSATALSGGVEGPLSLFATATTPAVPLETPLGVSAVASAPGSIIISWQPAAGAAYYRVYRAASAAGPYANIDSIIAAECTDRGLEPSTGYFYKVSALNDDGVESAQSSAASAATDTTTGDRLVPHTNIEDALTWLAGNAENNGSYIVRLDIGSSIAPKTLSYSGKNNITITLVGSGANRIISLNASGFLFAISSGVTFVLDGRVTLNGRTSNYYSLVRVNSGGKLILNEGAKIIGNTSSSYSGGVFVENTGLVAMNKGTISGNTAKSGGGVCVNNTGMFTKAAPGGIIYGFRRRNEQKHRHRG
jgi:hypothetical protein